MVVPAECYSSLTNVFLGAFYDETWSLLSSFQWAAVLPISAVASIVSLRLLQVQQDRVVVGGDDGLHGGTADIYMIMFL